MRLITNDPQIVLELNQRLLNSENTNKLILFHIHGFGVNSNIAFHNGWLEPVSKQAGFDMLWMVDLVGHGFSTGPYHCADGDLQIKYLKKAVKYVQSKYPSYDVYLSGHSFGGYLAMRLTDEMSNVKCLSLAPGGLYFNPDGVPADFKPIVQFGQEWWFKAIFRTIGNIIPGDLVTRNAATASIVYDIEDPDYAQHVMEKDPILPHGAKYVPLKTLFQVWDWGKFDYSDLKKKSYVLFHERDLIVDSKKSSKFLDDKDIKTVILKDLPHEPPTSYRLKQFQIAEYVKGFEKLIAM